jgi:hypothetical protein
MASSLLREVDGGRGREVVVVAVVVVVFIWGMRLANKGLAGTDARPATGRCAASSDGLLREASKDWVRGVGRAGCVERTDHGDGYVPGQSSGRPLRLV